MAAFRTIGKMLFLALCCTILALVNGQRFNQPARPSFQAPAFRPPPRPTGGSGFNTLDLPDGAEFIVGNVRAGFSCEGRRYGYYADLANDCRIFHVCLPVTDENGFTNTLQWSFFCGNQTVFNQEHLVCDHHTDVDCGRSEFWYSRNDEFGVIPRKF